MQTREQLLRAKVAAVNKCHEIVNTISEQLKVIFTPLVGMKVLKVDGDLLAKYANLIPDFDYGNSVRIYRSRSNFWIGYVVNVCETVNGRSTYFETTAYIADLNGDTISKIYEPYVRRTDYTFEEILGKRKKYEDLKRQLDDARSDLNPFGEIDN